jgi:lysophospholipase L1-like esterase
LENGHGQRYLRDGLHPAEKGQQLMGRYIAKEIRNNYF